MDCVASLGAESCWARRRSRAPTPAWDAVLAKARGKTVYWNAWGGDERTNGFIAWVGDEVRKRYGVDPAVR